MDVSLSRNTVSVNKEMVSYYNTAVKCISNWYLSIDKSAILPENVPESLFSYATPEKTAEWTKLLAERTSDFSASLTLAEMPHVLTSHWSRDGVVTSLTESVELYRNTLEEIRQEIGADSLGYLRLERLPQMVGGLPICASCFDGDYPVEPPREDIRGEYIK